LRWPRAVLLFLCIPLLKQFPSRYGTGTYFGNRGVLYFGKRGVTTPQYFGNRGVKTPWFPKYRGDAHL